MPTAKTRDDVIAAFKAILDAAEIGATVYDYDPGRGDVDLISVSIYVISSHTEGAGFGYPNYHEYWRVQLSIRHTDSQSCSALAVKTANAILQNADSQGLRNINKEADVGPVQPDPNVYGFLVTQDFLFETELVFA